MADVVAAVAAALKAVPDRAIYQHAVPDKPVRDYLVVRASAGLASSENLAGGMDTRQSLVTVTSVSRQINPEDAGWTASQGAEFVVSLLAGRRMAIGRAAWMLQHNGSQAAIRDDELPEVVMYAVDQFLCQYQP